MPKLLFARPPVDAVEERTIRKLAGARHAPADWTARAQMIALSWDGMRVPGIAATLGCSQKAVRPRLARFAAEGLDGLGDRPGVGRKPRIGQAQRSQLLALVASPPPGRLIRDGVGELVANEATGPAVWTLDALTAAARAAGIDIARSQLDALAEIAAEVFAAVAHLLNLDLDIVFVDTTSTYFDGEAADELAECQDDTGDDGQTNPVEAGARAFGHAKDHRDDLPQVVLAMAVTRDGVPVRCWTFPGNSADTGIVRTVTDDLAGWNLRRCVWVADRGFASAANRAYLTRGGGHYIHAEKLRATNAEAAAALARPGRYHQVADNLRVKEVQVAPGGNGDGEDGVRAQRFVVCRNPASAERDATVRTNLITHLQQLIDGSDGWSARRRDEFVGSLKGKPGLRRYLRRTTAGLLRIDQQAIKAEAHLDGKWLLRTDDLTLTGEDLAAAYKQLTAVERGWRDLKGALGLRPVFHHREDRIRAHVQLCWLALLLIRVTENSTGQTWRSLHHQLDRLHLVTLATGSGTVAQRSATLPEHKAIWAALGLPEPPRFFDFTATPGS